MLQNIRDNSQGWIAKTIIGVIVVLMALTGFDAIIQSTSNSQNAADVNGEKITQSSLNAAVDMQRRQLIQQFGKDFDASLLDDKLLRQASLDSLVDRTLLLQGAKEAGMGFSDASLDQLILQTPAFQVDGKFNAARFDQILQQQGMGRMEFRERLKQDVLVSQLQASLAASNFVTDAELENFVRLDKQTRDFASQTIHIDTKSIDISDDELKAYYDEHKDQYMSPEQVVVEYVELRKESFFAQAEASDEELQALYQKEIANLAEQRRAAHILLEVNDKLSDEQAKAKLAEVAERLKQGEDFAKLAEEVSQDPGSASNGGDLGFAGPGVYDPEFEKSLYALKKDEVSAPVRSSFGWHLIKLLDVQAPEVPSFDSLKAKLEREVKAQQVEQRFVEAAKELEEASFEASDLAQPAQELGLQVQTSGAFGREGGEGVAANRQVVQAAFSPEVLEDGANSGAIELDPDTTLVLRVKEHKKPTLLPLEEVSAGIRDTLSRKKASEAAKAEGEALLAQLRDGGASGKDWKVVEAATRSQEGVEPEVLQALFRMAKPEDGKSSFAGLTLNNGDYVVLRLDGVGQAKAELSAEEKTSYRRFLASRAGQQDFAAYREQLKESADIERF
ncbi:SurA N-terminal domain-containing protein [Aquipseudomonas alcaligenes]|jgi:peptidyl-prolyl cis-trans isomerase D|uniref:Periplasmic chaperone PpiD n=1 Tax=Aquipseudomonas alcaligenes (strain ATCC 14909 / DSM 50342 / CCUG 1425 / JCM 20561 / NBRC 14159 / NCIMB 9945 / NCTC 10367 / 1577) TaxID=1215092 RepID=U2Z160_AQUA1|nr:SurA N-terminal domain-containing protein [Pseudomonas alcaligenes]GAD61496.1 peptidyl-prolyl cis-trans isomerase D [Pseudomonas alcaligenes NBRC 14159]SUD14928.1 PpiC-type peptidyl-prolyl cis-trans isomerase [Pseudomonas alcaligenes]